MGGTNAKEKRSGKNSKDEYVKFIMREQLRREKEFKDKSNDRDNIYNQVTSKIKKDSNSFHSGGSREGSSGEDQKSDGHHSKTFKFLAKKLKKNKKGAETEASLSPSRGPEPMSIGFKGFSMSPTTLISDDSSKRIQKSQLAAMNSVHSTSSDEKTSIYKIRRMEDEMVIMP